MGVSPIFYREGIAFQPGRIEFKLRILLYFNVTPGYYN
jgi:hypothetical protein